MQFLKEIISIISPQKIKNIKLLGGKNSKGRQYYMGIFDGSIEEEDELPDIFFPDAKNPKQSYADLKRATKKSLIDALFIVNLEKSITIDTKNLIDIFKQSTAVKILWYLGVRKGGVSFAKKVLKKALAIEHAETALSLATLLRRYFTINDVNSKNYHYFNTIASQQLKHLNTEEQIITYASNLTIKKQLFKTGEEIDELYEKGFSFAIKNIEPSNTLKTLVIAFRIILEYYEYHVDYENLIKYSEIAEDRFSQKTYPVPDLAYLTIYTKTIPFAFQYKQWQKAEELVDKCLKLLSDKSYNYHVVLVYRAMLGFHSGQYQIAYDSLQMHKQAKLYSPKLQEQWRIIEAWVMLFAGWDKIKLKEDKKTNFRVFTFINNTPILSKDKKGNNAAIQILKFLFLFQKGKYDQLYSMSTPFKLYAHRYLKSKITTRTRLAIRILSAIADKGFDKKMSLKKATPYLTKLKEHPLNFLEQRTVEIVPFEIVIEELFNQL